MSRESPSLSKKFPTVFTQESNLIGWQEKHAQISEHINQSIRKSRQTIPQSSIFRRRRYLSHQNNFSANHSSIFSKRVANSPINNNSLSKLTIEQPYQSVSVNRLLISIPNFQINKSNKTITRSMSKKRILAKFNTPRPTNKIHMNSTLEHVDTFSSFQFPARVQKIEKIKPKPYLMATHRRASSSMTQKWKSEG